MSNRDLWQLALLQGGIIGAQEITLEMQNTLRTYRIKSAYSTA